MGKKYVVLNFSDYENRGTPVNDLMGAIGQRAVNKDGTMAVHHMADLFAAARAAMGYSFTGGHQVQGILDASNVQQFMSAAEKYFPKKWQQFVTDCTGADKVLFSAHGQKDDTDHVYTEWQTTNVRSGDLIGVAHLLDYVLQRASVRATLTLVVCYGARTRDHTIDHEGHLSDSQLKTSFAFKLFKRLSGAHGKLRMTARTGATGAQGTSLLSETEDAIVASETLNQEFPGTSDEDALAAANKAYNEFDQSLDHSSLSSLEKKQVRDLFDTWFHHSDPNTLDQLVRAIDNLEWPHLDVWTKAARYLTCCCGEDKSWRAQERDAIEEMRRTGRVRHRLDYLKTRAQAKEAKYGKFVYERHGSDIGVSRMVKRAGRWAVEAVTLISG